MRNGVRAILSVLLLGWLTATAFADGDIDSGRELAEQFCTQCHNIEADGPFKLMPPSFASIAVYRSPEHIWGIIALTPLHSEMSSVGQYMDNQSLDDLVAYIVSLEQP